jgi:hypothetical protein
MLLLTLSCVSPLMPDLDHNWTLALNLIYSPFLHCIHCVHVNGSALKAVVSYDSPPHLQKDPAVRSKNGCGCGVAVHRASHTGSDVNRRSWPPCESRRHSNDSCSGYSSRLVLAEVKGSICHICNKFDRDSTSIVCDCQPCQRDYNLY